MNWLASPQLTAAFDSAWMGARPWVGGTFIDTAQTAVAVLRASLSNLKNVLIGGLVYFPERNGIARTEIPEHVGQMQI